MSLQERGNSLEVMQESMAQDVQDKVLLSFEESCGVHGHNGKI